MDFDVEWLTLGKHRASRNKPWRDFAMARQSS